MQRWRRLSLQVYHRGGHGALVRGQLASVTIAGSSALQHQRRMFSSSVTYQIWDVAHDVFPN